MPLKTSRDIMIPLSEYALVDTDATLLDAIQALDAAQNHVPTGRHPHRAVLVKGKDGRLVGKLGHHAFLAALEPDYADILDHSSLARAGLSKKFLATVAENMPLWKLDFDSYVRRAMNLKVADAMHPVAEHVSADAPVGDAIHKLITCNALSLIVTDGDEPVGVLRISDLFTVVSKLMKRRAAILQNSKQTSHS